MNLITEPARRLVVKGGMRRDRSVGLLTAKKQPKFEYLRAKKNREQPEEKEAAAYDLESLDSYVDSAGESAEGGGPGKNAEFVVNSMYDKEYVEGAVRSMSEKERAKRERKRKATLLLKRRHQVDQMKDLIDQAVYASKGDPQPNMSKLPEITSNDFSQLQANIKSIEEKHDHRSGTSNFIQE